MLKKIFIAIFLFYGFTAKGQNYPHILNYSLNGTPTYGVKIKTNLPFQPAIHMPEIHITGYNYGSYETIDLRITFYIYSDASDFDNPLKYYIHNSRISSAGGYTPTIYLSNENNKVVIYVADKVYYQRFTVSAFENMGNNSSWFQDWTAIDEPLTGTQTAEIPYRNRFKGEVFMSGNGIWNSQGNVGIGTLDPKGYKLAIAGKAIAEEVTVKLQSSWPDYVFNTDYKLMPLSELQEYIDQNKHLPELPSQVEVAKDGLKLGNINQLLTKKVEELTLYILEKDQRDKSREMKISQLQNELNDVKKANQSTELQLRKLEAQLSKLTQKLTNH